MTDHPTEPYFTPNIDIIVTDYTLALSEIESFSRDYGPRTGGDVRIVSRWGGPAAGGIGWGGPEIAVAIILGEMLRRASSDVYNLARSFIVDVYSKIRTRTGARLYIDGAMAIGVDSDTQALRILFCFPEGLTTEELDARIRLVEQHWRAVLTQFEDHAADVADDQKSTVEVNVCWDENADTWKECEPAPDDAEF